MPYGTIKIDTVTFTDAGVDKSVTLSGLVQNPTFSGNVTVTGTLSGVTVTGTTASFTSGNFTNISGGTHTITSGVFAAGSAASPSITFTGDLDTGIYSPVADQVAISTNGTGRLFVDASGKIGIGGAPNYNLDLYAGSANFQGANQGIYWDSATNKCAILADTGALKFSTGTSSVVERLRITSAGLVGVGTSTPGYKLDVNGEVAFSPNTAGKNTFYFTTNASNDASLFLKSDTTNKVNIQANGPSYFNGGNVGVGTTSPAQSLDVKGLIQTTGTNGWTTNGDTAWVYFGDSNNRVGGTRGGTIGFYSDYAPLELGAGGGVGSSSGAQLITFKTGTSERLRIDSSGRVGIGTSSPGAKLDVSGDVIFNGGGTQFPIQFANAFTPNSERADLLFSANATSNNALRVGTIASNGGVTLQGTRQNDSSQKVSLVLNPDGGSVGIGATPSAKLHVNTGTNENLWVGSLGGSGAGVYLASVNDSGSANTPMQIGSASVINFAINGTEAARIDSSRRLLVGTSTDSGGALLQINGNRIRIATAKTPASATDTGVAGEVCWDSGYIYVCTATNTWKRAALATW